MQEHRHRLEALAILSLSLHALTLPAREGPPPVSASLPLTGPSPQSEVISSPAILTKEAIETAGSSLATQIRLEVHQSGKHPPLSSVAERFLRLLAPTDEQLPMLAPTVKGLVETSWDLDTGRAFASAWLTRAPDTLWAKDFLEARPGGALTFQVTNLFYGPDTDQPDHLTDRPEAIRLRQHLTIENAQLAGINRAWIVWGFSLRQLKDGIPVELSSTVFETFSLPLDSELGAVSSGWLGEQLRAHAAPNAVNEFELVATARIATMTQATDGNTENSTIFRNERMRFAFDSSIGEPTIGLPDGSRRQRFSVLSREIPGRTEVIDALERVVDWEILANLALWKQESRFYSKVGTTIPIHSEVVQQLLVRDHRTGGVQRADAAALRLEPDQLLLVHVFAMWCGPCLSGMPKLDELSRALEQQGVRTISVCLNENARDTKGIDEYIEKNNFSHDFAIAPAGLSAKLETPVVPSYLVLNAHGKVLYAITPTTDNAELDLLGRFITSQRP